MKKLIEYFDRTYVINLSDRADRRRQVVQEFRRIRIEMPSPKVQFYTAVRPADKGRFVSVGERGCFNSHQRVLELAYQDGLQNVLICEDDICFRKAGSSFERELFSAISLTDNWDVIHFGYDPPGHRLTGPLARWQNGFRTTHCFAVNRSFIGRMLDFMSACESRPPGHPDGGPMSADGCYSTAVRAPDVQLLLAVPCLAHQRSSRTDVAPTHSFDRIVWLDPAVRAARAVKHRIKMLQDGARLRRQLARRS